VRDRKGCWELLKPLRAAGDCCRLLVGVGKWWGLQGATRGQRGFGVSTRRWERPWGDARSLRCYNMLWVDAGDFGDHQGLWRFLKFPITFIGIKSKPNLGDLVQFFSTLLFASFGILGPKFGDRTLITPQISRNKDFGGVPSTIFSVYLSNIMIL
jgi:hypothetical protein